MLIIKSYLFMKESKSILDFNNRIREHVKIYNLYGISVKCLQNFYLNIHFNMNEIEEFFINKGAIKSYSKFRNHETLCRFKKLTQFFDLKVLTHAEPNSPFPP
jgi:hypothetical protein